MKITGISPLFVKHASREAIDAAIIKATRNRDRWDRQVRALRQLAEDREAQIAAGTWPAPADDQQDPKVIRP